MLRFQNGKNKGIGETMKIIKDIEEIKEVITRFKNLKYLKNNRFSLELEILTNTKEYVNNDALPIIENKKYLLLCD